MQAPSEPCHVPIEPIRFTHPLKRVARSIARKEAIKIVAIGSSSTKGDGATTPAASYPSRLEAELKLRFEGLPIAVLNKGEGGQEAPDEVARFKNDVVAEEPTLVIWQVGTNAVWKDYYIEEVEVAIQRGLGRLSKLAADVVLMDLQYAPALINDTKRPNAERMVALIADAAKRADINVFQRFALMRHWNIDDQVPFDRMISNFDGNELHQNDWSYNCLAHALAYAITQAVAPRAI